MKKSIADKWIKALRSGKYKQTKNKLTNGKEFCCLGVLCEIAPKITTKSVLHTDETLRKYPKVMQWAGIKSTNGHYGKSTLTIDNDFGNSFNSIADIIEKNWEKL